MTSKSRKVRAKRMLNMVDDGVLQLYNDRVDQDTQEVSPLKTTGDKNITEPQSPTLQCLSANIDIESHLLRSPSTFSYESALFENFDFVASPTIVFNTPRQRKRNYKDRTPVEAIQYYNSGDLTDIVGNTPTVQVIELVDACDKNIPQEEELQYTILETVRQKDFMIDQTDLTVQHTTLVEDAEVEYTDPNILILECERTDADTNGQSDDVITVPLDVDFLVENQSTTTETPSTSDTTSAAKELTRKRRQHKEDWIRVESKKRKNAGENYSGCGSKKKFDSKAMKGTCSCSKKCGEKISQERRQAIFDEFWKLADHEDQWHYILRHVSTKDIKKMQLVRTKNRTQTIFYHFKVDDNHSETIDVCKKFFLNTLSITEKTVYTAIEKGKSEDVKDNRGHHDNRPRKMCASTELSVITHIKQFPVKESHYVRKDNKKLYLEETLNISKMYRLYYNDWFKNENYPNDVKMATKRQYETIFNTKFNYSFHKPKKDMCGQCTLYHQADAERKEQLKEAYTKHIKTKESVRELKTKDKLESDPTTTVVAIFDLEKVLTIPQSEVGIFHYKRKYPIYNFTIYNSLSGRGYCYLWHYQIAKRGANEIGSCLLNFIESESQRGVKNFIFYSDGCAGQNKNRIIFALYLYAAQKYGITIVHRYFETGHSQSEGDVMHSLIERAKKNHTIFTPDQMYGIIMNAKINGEKFNLVEMEQCNFFDLKEIMVKRYWLRADQTNEKVMWTKIHEIKVTQEHPDVIYFKYYFDDEYLSLDTAPNTRPARGRGKRIPMAEALPDVLKNVFTEPIALPKPLHDDLMSLCRTEAIPKHYHTFYNNLNCLTDSVVEADIDSDDSN